MALTMMGIVEALTMMRIVEERHLDLIEIGPYHSVLQGQGLLRLPTMMMKSLRFYK